MTAATPVLIYCHDELAAQLFVGMEEKPAKRAAVG